MKKYLRTILISLLLPCAAKAGAAKNVDDFLSCMASYEGKVLRQNYELAKVNEDAVAQKKMPAISTALIGQRDFINLNQTDQGYNVSVTQNIYSRNISKSLESLNLSVKAEAENFRAATFLTSVDKFENLLGYMSAREQLRITKNQIDRQNRILNIFDTLLKARSTDGSQILTAKSDILLAKSRAVQFQTQIESFRKILSIYSFFSGDLISDSFFDFTATRSPAEVPNRPEVKRLNLQNRSVVAKYEADRDSWWPSVDASLTYQRALNNGFTNPIVTEGIGALTLSVPLDEIYKANVSKSYDKTEMQRISTTRERTVQNLQVEADTEKKNLEDATEIYNSLLQSRDLLATAHQVLMKKVELNRGSYFEVSQLEDKIDNIDATILSTQLLIWRIRGKWALESIVQDNSRLMRECN